MAVSIVTSFIIVIVAVILGDILCGDVTNVRQANNAWPQLPNNNKNVPYIDSNSKSTTPWPTLGQPSRRHQQNNVPQTNGPPSNNRQPMWVRPDNAPNWVRNSPPGQKANIPNNNSPVGANTQNNNGVRGSSLINSPSVRNTANYNTNFLNGERGPVGTGVQNRQTSHNPNQNQKPSSLNTSINRINNGLPVPSGPKQGGNVNVGSNNKHTNMGALNPLLPLPGGGANKNQNSVSNNNGMMGPTSTGSMHGESGTPTTNQNQGPVSPQNPGDVEDYELREFSEELLTKDTNNAARHVTINLQGMTTSRSMNDVAPLPLLTIDRAAYTIPSVEKLMLLYNNYILETNQNEVYTAQEKIEENNLLDTILSTSVMQHTRNFLIKKGKIGRDPKDFKDLLRLIWFNMYSRGGGRIGSSGFEHIFLAELKNNQVSGLHNWLYFNEEEKANRANYLGYMKKIDLGTKGAIVKYHFTFHGVDKPVGSMFIGTSPELELALYSTCYILRADKICPLKMGGNRFIIRTYTYRYRGKNMIGSAFPEI